MSTYEPEVWEVPMQDCFGFNWEEHIGDYGTFSPSCGCEKCLEKAYRRDERKAKKLSTSVQKASRKSVKRKAR